MLYKCFHGVKLIGVTEGVSVTQGKLTGLFTYNP